MRPEADKRRFERAPIEEPVVIDVENEWTALGTSGDLSLGGMFIEAVDGTLAIPFGTPVVVHVRLSGELIALPAVVRWTRSGGIGVQFGSLGARETHAITEAVARHAPSRTRERAADDIAEADEDLTG